MSASPTTIEAVGSGAAEEPSAPTVRSGLAAIALLAVFHQRPCDPAQVKHDLNLSNDPMSAADVVRALKRLGLKARRAKEQPLARLAGVPLPVILEFEKGRFLVVGRRMEDGTYRVVDAERRTAEHLTLEQIALVWSGTLVLAARRPSLEGITRKFGFAWFAPSIWRYRKPLVNVLLASLLVQVCALLTPLLFQIVLDKVLVHKGYATLTMVTVAMLGIGVAHVTLQHLRTYILSHTASRIDVELGVRLFQHLLELPLAYFERRPSGLTVARVRELETVRDFLTGQGLSSAIDIPFTLIFLAILYLYAPLLAFIVTLSLPCYVTVAVLLRPALRERILERFNRNALSSQLLVESIVGMHTIKAMAVEPRFRGLWEERIAGYVGTSFRAIVLASVGRNTIEFINKATMALVLYFGALAVINGELTVGALVAFNMIMGQVTGPILRISQLWQDFQQVKVSVERLGDVLDHPREPRSSVGGQSVVRAGKISVRGVTFRYEDGGRDVLSDVSLEIGAGEVIGIVGPSGSGKSTFTKLIQRLYVPERGQVLIDGVDIAQADPNALRRQIGVVLQENLLFHRSIADNIALANPGLTRAQVIQAAQLAGADEFIAQLSLGYDTMVEERGQNLSGGQRQRLAIARALATNPRILILDEATSALDYESERVIQENMRQIIRGRTVIIIAHRLAAVRICDRIVGVQDGRLVEEGTHEDLVGRPNSLYGRLWRLQQYQGATA